MGERLKVGVVGTGHLGRHHVRILAEMPQTDLVGIYDQRPEVAAELAERHGTTSLESVGDVAARAEAVVLAVPTFAHARIGKELLDAGVHLLVEKPIASSLEEADALIAAAAAADRLLAVGHVEFYNPAVQALLAVGERPRFMEVERLAPFTPRSLDVNVLLDLMIHDLQLLHAFDPSPIAEIRATGIDVLTPRIDIANARVELESGLVANLTASRVSAEPTRKLRAFLRHRYFSIDFREQEVKGFGLREGAGDDLRRLIVPEQLKVVSAEPLRAELEVFVAACEAAKAGSAGSVRYVDGREGRRALETAYRVQAAIRAV